MNNLQHPLEQYPIVVLSNLGFNLIPLTVSHTTVCNRLSQCLSNWELVTQNQFVLRIVKEGVKIQFILDEHPTSSKPIYYELDQ